MRNISTHFGARPPNSPSEGFFIWLVRAFSWHTHRYLAVGFSWALKQKCWHRPELAQHLFYILFTKASQSQCRFHERDFRDYSLGTTKGTVSSNLFLRTTLAHSLEMYINQNHPCHLYFPLFKFLNSVGPKKGWFTIYFTPFLHLSFDMACIKSVQTA